MDMDDFLSANHRIFGASAPPGLTITEQAIRPGLVLAVIDGRLEAPAEIPLESRHSCVAICFFLSGEPGRRHCRSAADRTPNAAEAVRPDQTTGSLPGTMHRSQGRLSLTASQSVRILWIGLHPQIIFSLSDPAPGQVPAFLNPAVRAAEEKRSMIVSLDILDCPVLMKDRLQRLYQSLLTDSAPKLARESMVLELMYGLVEFSGPGYAGADFLSEGDIKRLNAARCILDADLSGPPGLTELAGRCGLSRRKLERGFKSLYANTVYGYLNVQRMEAAREMLARGRMEVNEAGRAVGYSNVSKFIAAFRRHFGVTPGCYKRDMRWLVAYPRNDIGGNGSNASQRSSDWPDSVRMQHPPSQTDAATLSYRGTAERGMPRPKITVPDCFASQKYDLVSFVSGLTVFLCEMVLDEPVIVDHASYGGNSFALGFMFSGSVSLNYGDKDSRSRALDSPVSLFYNHQSIPREACYGAGKPIRYVNIIFDPEAMHRLLGDDIALLPAIARNRRPDLKDRIWIKALRPAMQLAAHQVLGYTPNGSHSRLFLESKVLELITLYIQGLALESNQASAACSSTITVGEKDRLQAAREILTAEMDTPPTIAVLSRRLGINECRLKYLFKTCIGTTIYGHVQKERMRRAKVLLEEGLSVSETASRIGFVNFSHFAAAFRKYHGKAPSAFKYQR